MSNGFYFSVPFGTSGDQSTVPWIGTEIGTVNYTYGYGSNYSASVESDPSALLVDRLTFNNLMYSVTLSLQGLYQQGLPSFITAAENQTVAYPYNAAAMTYGPDGFNYYSIAAANTATPGTDPTKWVMMQPQYYAHKGLVPLTGVTGGIYSFATLGTGCTLTYTISGGAINAVTAVVAGGTGYAVGDLITPNGGNYDAVIRVTGVSGGAVTTVAILYGGTGFIAGTAVGTQKAKAYRNKISIAGVLTSNATFIMPNGVYLTNAVQLIVANNTTGNFNVTVFISNGADATTGNGVLIPQGSNDNRSILIDTDGVTDFWRSDSFSPMPGNNQTASPTSCQPNTTEWANSGSLVTFPLPTAPQDQDEFRVVAVGAGGWHISQITAQQIVFGNMSTTSGAGGSLQSTSAGDVVTLKYFATNSKWYVVSSIGNITVV